jgi:hypothetical protein
MTGQECQNRFNGFSQARKPLKRLDRPGTLTTRLKPGVNETVGVVVHIEFQSACFIRHS